MNDLAYWLARCIEATKTPADVAEQLQDEYLRERDQRQQGELFDGGQA